jgi:hypothetical protein
MTKTQVINNHIVAALQRLDRPASLLEVCQNMRESGFEFTRRICINDIYVFARHCKGIRKSGKDLYELNLEVA